MARALAVALLALVVLLLAACSPAPPPTPRLMGSASASPAAPLLAPEGVPAGARLSQPVTPERYELELEVDPKAARFQGSEQIDVTLASAVRSVFVHARGLEIGSARARVGGQILELEAKRENDTLVRLSAPRSLPAGRATLELHFGGPYGRLEGLYTVARGVERYAFTQFEPTFAREAFPCFDEPEHKTPFDVSLVVGRGDRALSNTPERSREQTPDGRDRVRFQRTKPLPTYLVAFAVGPLDVVESKPIPPNAVRKEPLPLRGVAVKGRGKELAIALERTAQIVAELEGWFGIPYPYEKLDMVAVPDKRGAMENPGLVTFREWLLFLGEHATARQERYFALVTAHELAHHWFGDLVTMRWWDDLWLKEGFATFMATKAVAALWPDYRMDLVVARGGDEAMSADSLASARQVRQAILHEGDIHNAYDSITYQKGAALLSTLERWLGPKEFQAGVRRYLREHAHGSAWVGDLWDALRKESGKDVAAALSTLVDQPGLPVVQVTKTCKADKEAELTLRVERYRPLGASHAKTRFVVPVCLRWLGPKGAGGERCVLTEGDEAAPKVQVLQLEGACPDLIVPNAGGDGYYRFTAAEKDYGKLLGSSRLTLRERLVTVGSLVADVRAGRFGYRAALALLEPLVKESEPALALAAADLLRLGMRAAEGTAVERDLQDRARRLYSPRAKGLGWAHPAEKRETPEALQLRQELLGFLATGAREPGTRKAASAEGKRFLAWLTSGAAAAPPLDTNLVGVALAVFAEDGGAAGFGGLLDGLAKTDDEAYRSHLVWGLASAHAPEEVARRSLALALDPRLGGVEVPVFIDAHLRDTSTRAAAYTWLGAHWDEVVARLPPASAAALPHLAMGHCTKDSLAQLERVIAPRLKGVAAAARALEQVRESISLCSRLAEHLAPDLAAVSKKAK